MSSPQPSTNDPTTNSTNDPATKSTNDPTTKSTNDPTTNSTDGSTPVKVKVEIGESSKRGSKRPRESSSSQLLCEICTEKKGKDDMFPLQNCGHTLCTNCISKHIHTTIKKKKTLGKPIVVTCPGVDCACILMVNNYRNFLPGDILSFWDGAICESLILPDQRFYCPFENCEGVLLNDGEGVIREAECPYCWRLFCAVCRVPWHSGVECKEPSGMRENDVVRENGTLHELAKKNKWQRCPSCKFFVEKTHGCLHMTCRCGYHFCYTCGAAWNPSHRDTCKLPM